MSTRITKAIAESTASKVVAPIDVKMKEIESQIEEIVTEIYIKQIPKEVMILWAKFPNYCKRTTILYLNSNGFSKRAVRIKDNKELPREGNGSWGTPEVTITKEQAVKLNKLEVQKEKLKEKEETTYKEVESTLLALGTYKRVQENMAKLYNLLPTATNNNMQLMINLAPLNEKIDCLLSEDTEKKCISKL